MLYKLCPPRSKISDPPPRYKIRSCIMHHHVHWTVSYWNRVQQVFHSLCYSLTGICDWNRYEFTRYETHKRLCGL